LVPAGELVVVSLVIAGLVLFVMLVVFAVAICIAVGLSGISIPAMPLPASITTLSG